MDEQPTQAGAVVVDGLVHRYGPVVDGGPDVLDHVSLTIEPGASVALLGPSGCGKTTLLRAIAGLEHPRAGVITIDGETVLGPSTFVAPERRRVGMVFQDWALFPHMSVARNVGYGLARSADRASLVDQALEQVGLSDMAARMPATLSGGQQQRVALARALAPRPRVLLLDEPFSNLDTNLRAEVRTEVRRLLLEVGITAVFVTHDQEEAFVLGDQVAVMRQGRVVQMASPQDLYRSPVNRWVAEFVGDATIVRGEANGTTAETVLGLLPLDEKTWGPVDVLVRPEQLRLVAGETASVELVEFFGHDAMVHLSQNGHDLRVRTHLDATITRGDRVGVTFAGAAARAFPAAEVPDPPAPMI